VMFGGLNSFGQFGTYWSDVRILGLAGEGRWLEAVPGRVGPTVGYGPSMALDTSRGLGLLFGGMDEYCVPFEDLWSLDLAQLPTVGGVEPAGPQVTALELPSPNPCFRETRVAFSLARGGRARVAVFDIAGRTVRILADKLFTSGRHTVLWDGRESTGVRAESGIYFCRLNTSEGSISRKMMLLR
jgi:hypothetical protein